MEFAIEDVRVIRAHEQRKKRFEAKAAREQGDSKPVEGEGEDGKKRPNEKVEWQMKCKEKRMRKRGSQAEKKEEEMNESEGAPSPGKDGVFVVSEKRVPARASERKRKMTAPGIQTETADDGKLVGRGSAKKKKKKKNGLAPVSQHEAESVNSALIGRKRKAARDDSDIARVDNGEGEGSMRHRPRAAKQQKTGSGVKRSDSERLEGQGVKPAGKQSRKVPQYSNCSIVYAHQYLL